jgi:hypothetical protein
MTTQGLALVPLRMSVAWTSGRKPDMTRHEATTMEAPFLSPLYIALFAALSACASSEPATGAASCGGEALKRGCIREGSWRGREITYVEGQVLVGFVAGATPEDVGAIAEEYDAVFVRSPISDVLQRLVGHFELPEEGRVFEMIEDLERTPFFEYVEPSRLAGSNGI